MSGMSAITGKKLGGLDHLAQSIRVILGTPIGSRVMRFPFGSELPELIDAPMTPGNLINCYAAAAVALDRWEPRFRLKRVVVVSSVVGHAIFDLTGDWLPGGKEVTLPGISVKGLAS